MILRQVFHAASCSYTYLIAGGRNRAAVLIDPVLEDVDRYVQLLEELDLRLVTAIDTICMPIACRGWQRCASTPAASPR